MRQYFEEFGHIEVSERKFRRRVRLPKIIKEDLEPFKKKEIRDYLNITKYDQAIESEKLDIEQLRKRWLWRNCMSSQCRGFCSGYTVKIPFNEKYYSDNRVFCRHCERFMKIPTVRCPCCKSSVRYKPRSKKKYAVQI